MPCRILLALLHEGADGGRGAVQDRDLVVLHDLPPAIPGRGVRGALVHDPGRRVRQRPVDDVRMAGHPADVRGAPIHVIRLDVEDHLVGVARTYQITGGGVDDALRFRRRARRVQQVQELLRVDRHGRARLGLPVHDVRPPYVATRSHRRIDRVAEPARDQDMLDRRSAGDRLVGRGLEGGRLAPPPAAVGGDQDLRLGVVDPAGKGLGRKAAEDHRVGGA